MSLKKILEGFALYQKKHSHGNMPGTIDLWFRALIPGTMFLWSRSCLPGTIYINIYPCGRECAGKPTLKVWGDISTPPHTG